MEAKKPEEITAKISNKNIIEKVDLYINSENQIKVHLIHFPLEKPGFEKKIDGNSEEIRINMRKNSTKPKKKTCYLMGFS